MGGIFITGFLCGILIASYCVLLFKKELKELLNKE